MNDLFPLIVKIQRNWWDIVWPQLLTGFAVWSITFGTAKFLENKKENKDAKNRIRLIYVKSVKLLKNYILIHQVLKDLVDVFDNCINFLIDNSKIHNTPDPCCKSAHRLLVKKIDEVLERKKQLDIFFSNMDLKSLEEDDIFFIQNLYQKNDEDKIIEFQETNCGYDVGKSYFIHNWELLKEDIDEYFQRFNNIPIEAYIKLEDVRNEVNIIKGGITLEDEIRENIKPLNEIIERLIFKFDKMSECIGERAKKAFKLDLTKFELRLPKDLTVKEYVEKLKRERKETDEK